MKVLHMSAWQLRGLPENLSGLSFLDVGCWEGELCAEAVLRGADSVLGIDYCTCPDLLETLKTSNFSFIQMDIFSEKALQLPEFDVIHCGGVLYHVENPFSLLHRLRKLCRLGGQLFIETTWVEEPTELPILVYHPRSTLDDNPSNWWSANELCLREMMTEAGFSDLEITHRTGDPRGLRNNEVHTAGRIGISGRATSSPSQISQKMLPRRPSYMTSSVGAGNRRNVVR